MKRIFKCPVCKKVMKLGKVDNKIVACCENEVCLSVLVFGDPIQPKDPPNKLYVKTTGGGKWSEDSNWKKEEHE